MNRTFLKICEASHHRGGSRCRNPHRGFTLAELSISVVASSILMAGIASSIFIASKAASKDTGANGAVSSALTVAEIASDLCTAKTIQSQGIRSITLKVADRDGNGSDETIQYAWSGINGAALTRTYNGSTFNMVSRVYAFNLTYSTQSAEVKRKVLFVRGNVTGTRATYDGVRRDLVNGWGFEVIPYLVTATTPQSEINAMVSSVDAIYVSSTVDPAIVGNKFANATKGVVLERAELYDSFKISDTDGVTYSGAEIKLETNSHYITSGFPGGKHLITSTSQMFTRVANNEDLASGAVMLYKSLSGSDPIMTAMDGGATSSDGSASPGRRVQMPWGDADFNPSLLTERGCTLLMRSLEWAACEELNTAVEITLQVGESSAARVQTRVRLVGEPAV